MVPVAAAQRAKQRAPQPPAVYVGSRKILTRALLDRGRVLVPVRGVFEAIGADVTFSPPHIVIVRQNGTVIAAFILGRSRAIAGQRAVDLDVPPTRRDGRVYVPLRIVSEAAGATVAYRSHPPVVHISPRHVAALPPPVSASSAPVAAGDPDDSNASAWRLGVGIATGLCALGCLVLTARRFGPALRRPVAVPRRRTISPAQLAASLVSQPDMVALSSVEANGEARVHKQVVRETRTIEVPVEREELVIEYAGSGGQIIIEGRPLEAGETVRIPLWEERVHIDVTKHVLLREDVTIEKRRIVARTPVGVPVDADIAEGSPS
jgi:uncharacterized protein (TIGR02271 family)